MIRLIENIDLTTYNSFHLNVKAEGLFEFTESEDLLEYLKQNMLPAEYMVLGGGSNLLFRHDYPGWLIHPNIPGIVECDEDRNYVYLEAGAGVEWDDFVRYSVQHELGGVENLSLIPGTVGASPVQNIGAYGVEAKDRIHEVKGIHLKTHERIEFSNEECRFGYRDSIFKNEFKNGIVVTSVVFKLDKFPLLNLQYGALKREVERLGESTLANVRQAVINIRESKLPDPQKIGNAGSFFKNPVVDQKTYDAIAAKYKDVPFYPLQNGTFKMAAGWLIEQCGWKGYREDDVGVHQQQALVLINYGKGSGEALVNLSEKIKASILDQFGIALSAEVNII